MKKKILYNYYIKSKKNSILITIVIVDNKLTLYEYCNDNVNKTLFNNFIIKNNEIFFNDYIFSNNKIKYESIDINFNIKKTLFKKLFYVNFNGKIDEEVVEGKLCKDIEICYKSPIEYQKTLYISDNFDILILSSVKKYIDYNKIKLFFNINDNVIKDNSYIAFRNKKNNMTIKTYQYIYNFVFKDEIKKNNDNNCLDFNEISTNISINKTFKESFINVNDKKMLIITYKINN